MNMASRVDKTTLISQPWQNVYDLIKDNSNVVDPISTSTDARKWVYSRDPDIKGAGFELFPYIVVNPATAVFGEAGDGQSVDTKGRNAEWSIEVEIVTADRGVGDQGQRGNEYNNEITDDILETFNSTIHRQTLRDNGMSFSTPVVTAQSVEQFKNTLVYRRTVFLTFKTRMQVSS